jgi:serine phosphatase RsbU (regulator of sigma subunit)
VYGEDRLTEALGSRLSMPPAQLFDELLAEIRAFSIRQEFSDDVCLVGVEVARIGPNQRAPRA